MPEARAAPRDSATVLLLRDRPDQSSFEVFMVRRHGKSAFMGGAHVFPGGTLNAVDRSEALWSLAIGHDVETAAHALGEADGPRALALFCAAVRETFEEAGVLLADVPQGADLEAARRELAAGAAFDQVVRQLGARLRLDRLVPLARWITPEHEPRRYDARFFVAPAPPEQRAEHDDQETTAGAWLSPEAALREERAGRIQLPPPTMRTLEALSDLPSAQRVLHEAAGRPPPKLLPVLQFEGGRMAICLPGDPNHPEPERAFPGPTRLTWEDGHWRSGNA